MQSFHLVPPSMAIWAPQVSFSRCQVEAAGFYGQPNPKVSELK